ncbi:MAG: cadherin-like domain-containing protein [Burkholderiales bacterium]|nr:cadherin-like domain-containing protein [Burkholderiales bacterium]
MDCPRSITFTLAGTANSPAVEISAVEMAGGQIAFTLKVLETASLTADLRGLFFDMVNDAKLAGLKVSEAGAPRITDFDTVDVLSLKNGANMNGAASPFDVGMEFGTQGMAKDDIKSASFTLSNAAGNLTLDDIAHVDFGVRLTSIGSPTDTKRNEKDGAKLVATSPAAPDAHDDHFNLFEDGAAGLNDPRHTSQGVKLAVLANDTDADAADKLSVVHVEGAQHGTLQIVDGPDADSLPGDAILYTPAKDWSGSDSFSYCISDGHGGMDSAQVSVDVAAVADQPLVTVSVIDAADAVNQVRVHVSAQPTDIDGSETLASLLAGPTAPGVSIAALGPVTTGPQGQLAQDFMLTLPLGQSIDADQLFTAQSQEASNGDTESGQAVLDLVSVFKHTDLDATLKADDASLWANGQDPQADILGPMLGIEAGPDISLYPYPVRYELKATVHAGFQPFLSIEGGTIDAALDYDVAVETTLNKTTDTLLIHTDAQLAGGQFSTQAPGGHMGVDFVFGYDIGVKLGLDFDGEDLDVLEVDFVNVQQSDQWSLFNLIDIAAGDPSITIDTSWLNGSSGTVAFPSLQVASSSFDAGTGKLSGSGAASFIEVQSDLDSLLLGSVLGNVSPFDIPLAIDCDVDPMIDVSGFLRLLDLDVGAQLKLVQNLDLQATSVTGTLTFENNQTMPVVFGQDIVIQNALTTYDDPANGGNGNGRVDYTLSFDGVAQLHNKTDVAVEKTIDYKVLDLDIAYDLDFVVDQEVGSFHEALVDIHDTSTSLVGVADQSFAIDLGSVSWGLGT